MQSHEKESTLSMQIFHYQPPPPYLDDTSQGKDQGLFMVACRCFASVSPHTEFSPIPEAPNKLYINKCCKPQWTEVDNTNNIQKTTT